jgi:hypothetical protein
MAVLGPVTVRKYDGTSYSYVDGPVPLATAREIYRHPVGRTDVRAGGHACAEPPDKHVTWLLDGDRVVADPDGAKAAEWAAAVERFSSLATGSAPVFTPDPSAIGAEPFVVSYHVDTELGLYVLLDHLRRIDDDNPLLDYVDHFVARRDEYERLIERAQAKMGPDDDLDHLRGFFRCVAHGVRLRDVDEVERELRKIAGDVEYHQRTLVRCMEKVGPADALGTLRRLVTAIEDAGLRYPRLPGERR